MCIRDRDNISYKFEPRQFYVIKGVSGSGKSTLVKVLVGILQASKGKVIRNLSSEWNHKDLMYIPQNPPMLNANIDKFISWPDEDHDEKSLDEAKQFACVDFDSNTGQSESSVNLVFSGGQLQRLHLARLFYHKPKVVIMDESTSAIDLEKEKTILGHLKEYAKKNCVIAVAHRTQFEGFATKILTLKNGEVI